MALGSVEPARRHLLSAIRCRPEDPKLSFYFVDAYTHEGRFVDGFALLERTYDTFAPGRPEQLLALYRLTLAVSRGSQTSRMREYSSNCAGGNSRSSSAVTRRCPASRRRIL